MTLETACVRLKLILEGIDKMSIYNLIKDFFVGPSLKKEAAKKAPELTDKELGLILSETEVEKPYLFEDDGLDYEDIFY